MMRVLLPLPVVVPLIAAGACMASARQRTLQRAIAVVAFLITTGASIAMLVQVDRHGPEAANMGGWMAPVGIALVADRFSTLMLVVASPVLLAVLVFAMGQPGTEQEQPAFHPVYLVLAAGVGLSFLTGDLFNLFVAFEMMLTASYVLITLGGRRDQVQSGMTYVVINLVASTLFVVLLALLYASLGTVNMADLAQRMHTVPQGVRVAFALLMFVVFGIKAAVFPLFFWLPDSYPTAPTPITAVFAGLLTKVGVYCLIRTQTLIVLPGDRISGFILTIAAITMVVGVLGAIAQDDIKRILSFHIVSQIGYMVLGLGLFTVAGIAAAMLYVINQIVLKSTLLLVGGLVDHAAGSTGLKRIGGIARRFPILGWMFLLPALSLAGIPPFSGFVAKLSVVQAGLDVHQWLVVGISLVVSALTLFSMSKIWGGAFWGEVELVAEPGDPFTARYGGTPPMLLATGALVVASLGLAVAAGPVFGFCERAAADLLEPTAYVKAVLG
ncbi:Na+/H+ antiporter subunit D [soil metagenome]